jgi:hypothetical protein
MMVFFCSAKRKVERVARQRIVAFVRERVERAWLGLLERLDVVGGWTKKPEKQKTVDSWDFIWWITWYLVPGREKTTAQHSTTVVHYYLHSTPVQYA